MTRTVCELAVVTGIDPRTLASLPPLMLATMIDVASERI